MRTKHGDRTSVASPISYPYPALDTESEFGEVRVATVALQLSRSPHPVQLIWFARAASLVSSSIDHKLTLDHWLADMKVVFTAKMILWRLAHLSMVRSQTLNGPCSPPMLEALHAFLVWEAWIIGEREPATQYVAAEILPVSVRQCGHP